MYQNHKIKIPINSNSNDRSFISFLRLVEFYDPFESMWRQKYKMVGTKIKISESGIP